MGLVQTVFLGALAALAIPLIVHLVFRMRTRRVDLGTVRFLREVLHKMSRRKKLKRWLLLMLRMACVLLLALLFARPYFVDRQMGTTDRLVAVLIDRSASMELRSGRDRLIDQAVEQAQAVINKSRNKSRIELAFFDHTVRPPTSDDVLLEQETSFCATDYGAAFSWARDICVKAGRTDKELHVFTDLQRSGLDWSEIAEMPGDVRVRVHDLGRDSPNNAAIIAADVKRTLIRPGDTATVNVTVSNTGPFPLTDVPLRLFLRSERRTVNQEQQISLAPGGLEQFEFQLERLDMGLWQGQVELVVDDELRFDNRRFLAMMAAPPWKVLIVDGQPHASPVLSETYFLEAALRLAPPGQSFELTPYDPRVVTASDVTSLEFDGYDIVILANLKSLSDSDAKRLEEFVTVGGGLVVFSGDQIDAEGYRSLETVGLSPGRIAGIRQSDDLPWRLHEWDEKHSIFDPLNDPQHGDLRRVAFQAYTRIEPSSSATVLATFRGGDPALIKLKKGAGRALWFASSCDRQWSDWPRSRLYLPLVHQMLGHLSGLNEGGPIRALTIDASSQLAADVKPGVYEKERYWEVINASARESETDRCTLPEFADRFALRVGDGDLATDQAFASVGPTTVELRDDEVWHLVVFVLLGVLCVECLLANRTTA